MKNKNVIRILKNRAQRIEPDAVWLNKQAALLEVGLKGASLDGFNNKKSRFTGLRLFSLLMASLVVVIFAAFMIISVVNEARPGETLYSVQGLRESLELGYTGLLKDDLARAQIHLHIADNRIADLESLTSSAKTSFLVSRVKANDGLTSQSENFSEQDSILIEELVNDYHYHLDRADHFIDVGQSRGLDADDLLEKVSDATLNHHKILLEIHERVPDEAKDAIGKAIERSRNGHFKAIEAIENVEKKKEVRNRLEHRRRDIGVDSIPEFDRVEQDGTKEFVPEKPLEIPQGPSDIPTQDGTPGDMPESLPDGDISVDRDNTEDAKPPEVDGQSKPGDVDRPGRPMNGL